MLTKEEQAINERLQTLRRYQEEAEQRHQERETRIKKYDTLLRHMVAKRLLAYGLDEYKFKASEYKVFDKSEMSRVELQKQVNPDVEKELP